MHQPLRARRHGHRDQPQLRRRGQGPLRVLPDGQRRRRLRLLRPACNFTRATARTRPSGASRSPGSPARAGHDPQRLLLRRTPCPNGASDCTRRRGPRARRRRAVRSACPPCSRWRPATAARRTAAVGRRRRDRRRRKHRRRRRQPPTWSDRRLPRSRRGRRRRRRRRRGRRRRGRRRRRRRRRRSHAGRPRRDGGSKSPTRKAKRFRSVASTSVAAVIGDTGLASTKRRVLPQRAHARVLRGVAGEHVERRVLVGAGPARHGPEDDESVDHPHVHVEQDDVELLPGQEAERLGSVGHQLHVGDGAERPRQRVVKDSIIVDDEDGGVPKRASRLAARSSRRVPAPASAVPHRCAEIPALVPQKDCGAGPSRAGSSAHRAGRARARARAVPLLRFEVRVPDASGRDEGLLNRARRDPAVEVEQAARLVVGPRAARPAERLLPRRRARWLAFDVRVARGEAQRPQASSTKPRSLAKIAPVSAYGVVVSQSSSALSSSPSGYTRR